MLASGEQRLVKAGGRRARPAHGGARQAHPQRQERHGGDAAGQGVPHRARAAAAACDHRRRAHQPGAGAGRQAPRLRRDHRRSAHRVRLAGALPGREGDRRMAGRGAARRSASIATPPSSRSRTIRRSTIRRSSTRSPRDCFYIGALGSRKTHARRLERLQGGGHSRMPRSRASMRRSASTSARCRRPRSRSRSWARSPRGCARARSSAESRR